MNSKKIIWLVLVVFVYVGFNINEAGSQPPFPPAKVAGYVYLNGELLKGANEYYLKAVIKDMEIRGKIDLHGRYSLLIPANKGVEQGDEIYIKLYCGDKTISSTKIVSVPEFGTMKVINLLF